MLYVGGKALSRQDNWQYMKQQVEEFRAVCDSFKGTEAPIGRTPITQKYFNKLYCMVEQEEAGKCIKLPSTTTSERSAS